MHQAAPTLVGHGEGYELFHDQDRHKTAQKVLEGQLEWKHPVEEVNEYIENLNGSLAQIIYRMKSNRSMPS